MNQEYEYRFGQNLKRLREACGLTQEQAAAQMQIRGCDITRSALAKIEVGQRHVYPDEIRLFAEIYRAGFEWIFIE